MNILRIGLLGLVMALGACGTAKKEPDLVEEMTVLRDQMCHCSELACLEPLSAKMQRLLPRLAQMREQPPSPEVARRLQALAQEMLTCAERQPVINIEL